tara:strand:+ start:623 stop:1315 length:693 start_codon:yes stop_codon:yes gene_type:complete
MDNLNTKKVKINHVEFYIITSWLKENMAGIKSGMTLQELTDLLNSKDEINEKIRGEIPKDTVARIANAVDYKYSTTTANHKKKVSAATIKNLENKIKQIENKIAALDIKLDEIKGISPEDEPVSTTGEPAVRDWDEVSKIIEDEKEETFHHEEREELDTSRIPPAPTKLRDDNDAQLDDVHPEDAPHQEEILEQGTISLNEEDKPFQGLEPSPDILKILQGQDTEHDLPE